MENATKALMIAGGVLLAVMIMSLGVYIFQNSSKLTGSYFEKLDLDTINAFNNKFLIYAKNISPQEMVSVINLVKENNQKGYDIIKIKINGTYIDVENLSEEYKIDLMRQTDVNNEVKYKFISVNYAETGIINELVWK